MHREIFVFLICAPKQIPWPLWERGSAAVTKMQHFAYMHGKVVVIDLAIPAQ
jgi:hypothetical protein